MQSHYPAEFQREQGFTEADWLRCLPGASAGHALTIDGPGQATVAIGSGRLHLTWQVRPPRRVALFAMPMLVTRYRFEGVPDDARQAFMKFFDLYTQRGGG